MPFCKRSVDYWGSALSSSPGLLLRHRHHLLFVKYAGQSLVSLGQSHVNIMPKPKHAMKSRLKDVEAREVQVEDKSPCLVMVPFAVWCTNHKWREEFCGENVATKLVAKMAGDEDIFRALKILAPLFSLLPLRPPPMHTMLAAALLLLRPLRG